MLIDTHCHMNLMFRDYTTKKITTPTPLSASEIATCTTILTAAAQQNVTKIINIGTDHVESLTCIDIARHFSNCYATIGLHPTDATEQWQTTIAAFNTLLQQKKDLKIVGIGECGVDAYHANYQPKLQQEVFVAQIALASTYNVPLVIHSRNADKETYDILYAHRNEPNFKGVIHCFSATTAYAKKYIDLGFALGFGGTVTYPKNEELRTTVKTIPLETILLETDAPFLAPQSIRGKQNSPAEIATIAHYIASIRQESYEKIAATTTHTALQLFAL